MFQNGGIEIVFYAYKCIPVHWTLMALIKTYLWRILYKCEDRESQNKTISIASMGIMFLACSIISYF
jgi:hypothetical protein